MVRPKASIGNLRVALAVANTAIVQGEHTGNNAHLITGTGPGSVQGFFCRVCPELARNPKDKNPINREGVTCAELNKALKRAGLRILKKRRLSPEGATFQAQVGNSFHA